MKRALLLLFLAAPLFAQKNDDAILDDLYKATQIHRTAISPDGQRVAWSVLPGGIRVANADGSGLQRVSAGKAEDERELAWSPDSQQLAFLSDAERRGQRQLYVTKIGGTPRKLTSLDGWLDDPKWSPDGKSIAVLHIAQTKRAAGPLVATGRAVGVIEETIEEQRVAIVDAATGEVRVVSPADMYVYECNWSADSKRLAAVAAPGSGDDNWWIAQLHVIDVAGGTMKPLYKPKWQIADPHFSWDGTRIAFIEGLMSDAGSTGGDVMITRADGGEMTVNATSGQKFSATSILLFDRNGVTFGANAGGDSAVMRVRTGIATFYRAPEVVTSSDVISVSFATDGETAAAIRSSFGHPPEVWAGKLGAWKQISHENESVKVTPGEAKAVQWTTDAGDVQGWLLFPKPFDPSRKYPMVVWVHGGPASASLNRWPREEATLLSNRGYFVFYPNPRGSFGEGEAFAQGNVKDFGYGDLRDILAGVDAVVKDHPVDSKRVGVWGWSYGGYMTMWAVTQTDRFKAAVAGAGIANWQSYYGENAIDQWMIPYFGASVYDDPAVYAKSSPITFIKQVKTPTLILVGERDGEVPAPQSFEFWHALKALGVETKLVVYADEGHRILQPEHKRDVTRRVLAWFDGHL